jgi:predicted DCC family thiol-disulfide oxidoreductase YuxK
MALWWDMRDRELIHIIYDGQCGFCVRSLKVARTSDVRGVFRFHDATDRARVEEQFPALQGVDLDSAMYVVADGGRTYRGFFAFRRLVWCSPFMWPLLLLFYFPGATLIGPRVYGWVARHRANLGCGSPLCPLPPPSGADHPRERAQEGSL